MSPARYTAQVLPNGHLPLPKDFPVKAGDTVEVTIASVPPQGDEEVGKRQREYGDQNWAGTLHSGKTDISERHDDYLWGGEE